MFGSTEQQIYLPEYEVCTNGLRNSFVGPCIPIKLHKENIDNNSTHAETNIQVKRKIKHQEYNTICELNSLVD